MLECLEERDFPVSRLVPLASARSVGKTVRFRGEDVPVREATPEAFEGVDIVLGAAGDAQAKELLPEAAARGAVCVDNSHAFRLDEDVPLVIPEINAADIADHPRNIIANPNCATIIGLVPIFPLHQAAGLRRLVVSTYQAASGAGMPGLRELEREMRALAEGEEVGDTDPFAYQLAYNLIPQIGGAREEGYTSEEVKMLHEGRKIMHLPELRAREILASAPGVKVVDDLDALRYPMPLDTSDQDLVYVGRIRRDTSAPEGVSALTLFCCGDQIRKGAATNAVQIAEHLV